jgi:hypothetical protein
VLLNAEQQVKLARPLVRKAQTAPSAKRRVLLSRGTLPQCLVIWQDCRRAHWLTFGI